MNILQQANMSTNELMRPEIIKAIDFIIKVNQKVASSVGQQYLAYLSQIFNDLIKIYKLYSECISNTVKQRG
jgi:exportin-1